MATSNEDAVTGLMIISQFCMVNESRMMNDKLTASFLFTAEVLSINMFLWLHWINDVQVLIYM